MTFMLEDDLGFLMARTHQAMRRWLLSRLESVGITYEQFRVLNALCEQDNVYQVELAGRVNADPTSLARMLERMESAGMIQRGVDPSDARANRVTLTDKGRHLQSRMAPHRDLALRTALQGLSEEEVRELKRYLNQIYKNVLK